MTNQEKLIEACSEGQLHIVRELLNEVDVDINQENDYGWTPFTNACCYGGIEVVELLLLQDNIKINQANRYGWTPLHNACKLGQINPIKLLLQHPDIKVNHRNNEGFTPLALACRAGWIDVVELLLKHPGIDVNHKNNVGFTPLAFACEANSIAVVELLLKHPGIAVNHENNAGFTPLALACRAGWIDVVELLLKHPGIDVNHENNAGETPLYLAFDQFRKHKLVALLLKYGADISEENKGIQFICSAMLDDVITVQQMLGKDAVDINELNEGKDYTLFYYICGLGLQRYTTLMLQYGGDVKKQCESNVALHFACIEGHLEVANILLDNGALDTINLVNFLQISPFMMACRDGNLDMAKLLLERCASFNKLDDLAKFNLSKPVSLACENGHLEIVEMIFEYVAGVTINKDINLDEYVAGVSINEVIHFGQHLLDKAITYNQRNITIFLVRKLCQFDEGTLLIKTMSERNKEVLEISQGLKSYTTTKSARNIVNADGVEETHHGSADSRYRFHQSPGSEGGSRNNEETKQEKSEELSDAEQQCHSDPKVPEKTALPEPSSDIPTMRIA